MIQSYRRLKVKIEESHDGIYVQVGIKKDDIENFLKIFKKTFWYRKDAIELINESWGM